MATNAVDTNRKICTDALRKAGVLANDEPATADMISTAKDSLGRMLKAWQTRKYKLWAVSEESVTATTSASFSLTSGRPLEIHNIRFKRNGIELPMTEMTRQQYDLLPQKSTTGTPTQYYFNRQRDTATFTVWPLLATASGETFEVTYVRELEDIDLDVQVDVPTECYDAVVYCLADRLLDDYKLTDPKITARAAALLDDVESFDREGSVYFVGEAYADY